MVYIRTEIGDLPSIADCHMAAFPKSLSTRLGRSYCSKMLSWYIESERGLLFHLLEGDEVVGYCGGIINRIPGQHGSTTSMTQHAFRSLIISLLCKPWLIFHKEIRANIPLIVRNISLKLTRGRSVGMSPAPASNNNFIPTMGLVVIGVSPGRQGKGYGSALLKEFEGRARKEGFTRISLSVHKENHRAIEAYKRNGWIVGKDDPNGLYMYKDLN